MGVCVLALLLASTLGGVRLVPESSCTIDLVRLLPCLPFVDGAAAAPSDMCCTNLGSMVHDELQCLCQALSQPGTFPHHRQPDVRAGDDARALGLEDANGGRAMTY
jgi:hypothetical protein